MESMGRTLMMLGILTATEIINEPRRSNSANALCPALGRIFRKIRCSR